MDAAELEGELVTLRPLEAGDADPLLAIHRTDAVSRWWGQPDAGFPITDEPGSVRFTILIDGRVAGMVQYSEEIEPDYRYAEIDIFLDPAEHGRGAGTDAMRVIVRHLVEDLGHHRVTLSTAVENVVALRCYEKAGFRRIGVAQAAGRNFVTGEMDDEWMLERVVLPSRV
ncbi:MAG: GNAT family N-acetyltransferase [Thermoleophilaceae bacterium]|nr:GNAT family N-acetyltransferase [Thermoleophilaceae bacterium]